MRETPEFFSERLRIEGAKNIIYFSELTPDQWQVPIYSEGETWTVRSVLAHYVTAEKGFIVLFSRIANGGEGVPEDFDIDRYNKSQQKKTIIFTPLELVKQFSDVRSEMVDLVATFSINDLNRKGRHPFLGLTSLAEMIKMVYRHNQIHYRDLCKVLKRI